MIAWLRLDERANVYIDTAETIEFLKAARPLLANEDGQFAAIVAAVSAIGGVCAAFFPNWFLARQQRSHQTKSTAFQIYAEIKATLEVERYRDYSGGFRDALAAFDSGQATERGYVVHVPDDRFLIYKANLANLGLLPPQVQSRVVLLYQLLEALVQDIKPGGLLNTPPAGREAFAEALRILSQAKSIAAEVLSEIQGLYPDVAALVANPPKKSQINPIRHP